MTHKTPHTPGANTPTKTPSRTPAFTILVVLALAVLGAIVALRNRRTTAGPTSPPESPASATANSQGSTPSGGYTPSKPPKVGVSDTPSPPATPAPLPTGTAALTGAQPSAYASQVVSNLANLDLSKGTLTPEVEAAWKEAAQKLAQEPGALPALATKLPPAAIEQLARNLEKLAPGQFIQSLVDTAGSLLADAAAGKAGKDDLGPLFRLVTEHGGAPSVALLESLTGNYKYYGTIALANLPDGAGIPSLIRMAQDPSPTGVSGRGAALQALAQAAPTSPEAAKVILEMAQAGLIQTPTWITIASVLGGHQFHIGNVNPDPAAGAPAAGNYRSWHLTFGNQNFYSSADPAGLTDEQISARNALIDQLRTSATNPTVLNLLQQAQNDLKNRGKPGPATGVPATPPQPR